MSNNDLKIEYTKAGTCLEEITDKFVKCALSPVHCLDGMTFRSSRWILSQTDQHPAKVCLTQQSLQAVSIGQCQSSFDENICASTASNCKMPNRFEGEVSLCNVAADNHASTGHPETIYGLCETYSDVDTKPPFCAWSKSDCPQDEVDDTREDHEDFFTYYWSQALNNWARHKLDCTCDMVHVGACMDSSQGQMYCAVDATVCEQDMEYVSVVPLRNDHKVTCFLCDDLISAPRTPSPTTTAHYNILQAQNAESTSGNDSNGLNRAALGGIIGGSIVVVLVVVILIVKSTVKKNRAAKRAQKAVEQESEDAASETSGVPSVELATVESKVVL
ncbi:hypothetical protein IV203_024463 [Nitzschia inconspicua]|uniref:Uncharacterized protein n=1 Tax=Nitzschia inconspicua TaxID=303405 RepID=A0A9K3KCX8_9STRA|nr:hypothetical protein IV203_024463 [Nitzschia inconspicua]